MLHIWKQEDPINHGLQGTLGPWNQDSAACAEAETAVHHQSFFRDSRVDRGGALGQETPVQKDGRWLFPHVHSQQPLLCSLSMVSWPLVLSTGTSS